MARRAPIGILMLQTRFPRIPGDIGNPATWDFPVLLHVVPGADTRRVVLEGARDLLPDFIAGARELIRQGAVAITTSCGFLALLQRDLAAALPVPVATSALLQVPWVQATLPAGKRVGVLTARRAALTPAHLAAVGVPADTPIAGMDGSAEFHRVFVEDGKETLDVATAEREVVEAGRTLVAAHPEIGALVLECTNMPPYARALRAALGLPVYDIVTLLTWLRAGLAPRDWS